jgi:hypothetical protein
MDERLSQLAAKSEDEDKLFVELVYHNRYARFDVTGMELKYLSPAEIVKRFFQPALAAVHVPMSEQPAPAVIAPSETTV